MFYGRELIKRVSSLKTLSQICSTDEDESKSIIIDECSTEEDESECVHQNMNKQKYAKNEAEYEEYSAIDEVPIYLTYSNVIGIF